MSPGGCIVCTILPLALTSSSSGAAQPEQSRTVAPHVQVIPKPAGGATKPPIMRSMSYNPAENAILINTDEEGGTYKFYRLPTGNPATLTSRGEVPESFAGQGATAVFIARNRFAVWNRFTSTIQVALNSLTRLDADASVR